MLNEAWSRDIFLLFSIEEEFNRKIQDVIANFSYKLDTFLEKGIPSNSYYIIINKFFNI